MLLMLGFWRGEKSKASGCNSAAGTTTRTTKTTTKITTTTTTSNTPATTTNIRPISPQMDQGAGQTTLSMSQQPHPAAAAHGEVEQVVSKPEVKFSLEEPEVRSPSPGPASQPVPGPEPDEQDGQMASAGAGAASIYAPTHGPGSTSQWYQKPFDDGATVNSNRSIAPAEVEYVWENGRRYCGAYHMPNDKQEQMRQLLYHEIYKSAFNNEITTVPLVNPARILDVGAGTGEWSIDAADQYPECEVTGIDIADMFPRYNAPNLFWEVDDAELEWLRAPDSYDLVHLRDMAGAFQDWSYIYQQAFKVCKPGGWIEVLDKDELQRSGNFMEFFTPDSIIHKVFDDWTEAGELSGRPIGIGHIKIELLRQAGFVDVTLTERVIPISPSQMETGHLFLKALIDAIESSSLRLLTKYKGYTAEEVRVAAARISKELKHLALKREMADSFVVKYLILTGRKPGGAAGFESQSTDADTSSVEMPATTSGPIDFDAMLQKHIHKYNVDNSPTETERGDTQLADREERDGPAESGGASENSRHRDSEAESQEFSSSYSGRPKSMYSTPVRLLIPRRTST